MHRQSPTGPVKPAPVEPLKGLHLIPADPLQPPVFPECTSIPVGPTSHYFSLLYEIIDHLLRRRARQNLWAKYSIFCGMSRGRCVRGMGDAPHPSTSLKNFPV